MSVMSWQENAFYVLCHIHLLNMLSNQDSDNILFLGMNPSMLYRGLLEEENVCNVVARECLLCFVSHTSLECSHFSNCCAWFLTKPTSYVIQIKILTTFRSWD
jgi:hypothetical protein